MTCLFNLAADPVRVPVGPGLRLDGPSDGAQAAGDAVRLDGYGVAFLTAG